MEGFAVFSSLLKKKKYSNILLITSRNRSFALYDLFYSLQ